MLKKRKNPNHEGTLYQIKKGKHKGTWVAQVTLGKTPDGKLKRKSFYGKTRAEAKEKMLAYMEQANLGINQDLAKSLTFGDRLATWMDLYKRPRLRTSTFENYQMYIRLHIYPALGHIPLASLNTDDIRSLYNRLQKAGKASATISKIHQIIHSCLEKAVEKRMLAWNPSKATEKPPVKSKRGQAMSEEDMDRFLAIVHQQPDKWRAVFLVLLGTGIRIGELLALNPVTNKREGINC